MRETVALEDLLQQHLAGIRGGPGFGAARESVAVDMGDQQPAGVFGRGVGNRHVRQREGAAVEREWVDDPALGRGSGKGGDVVGREGVTAPGGERDGVHALGAPAHHCEQRGARGFSGRAGPGDGDGQVTAAVRKRLEFEPDHRIAMADPERIERRLLRAQRQPELGRACRIHAKAEIAEDRHP